MGDVQAIAAALASGTSWGSLVSFLNTAPETTSTISDSKTTRLSTTASFDPTSSDQGTSDGYVTSTVFDCTDSTILISSISVPKPTTFQTQIGRRANVPIESELTTYEGPVPYMTPTSTPSWTPALVTFPMKTGKPHESSSSHDGTLPVVTDTGRPTSFFTGPLTDEPWYTWTFGTPTTVSWDLTTQIPVQRHTTETPRRRDEAENPTKFYESAALAAWSVLESELAGLESTASTSATSADTRFNKATGPYTVTS